MQAQEILQKRAAFVHALAEELLEHEYLLHSDIMRIKDQTDIDCML